MTGPARFDLTLPRKRVGSGVLYTDGAGRVLMVRPSYKPPWEIPGGAVEADESPRACAEREVVEELGCALPVGRLLVVDWCPPLPDRSEALLFVFDGGALGGAVTAQLTLPADELLEWRFVTIDEAASLTTERMTRRLGAALDAARTGSTAYLELGRRC